MDFSSLIGPAIVAAVVAGVVSLIGLLINRSTARAMHRERLDLDRQLAEKRCAADIALAREKVALDRTFSAWKHRTELAEAILADFLQARDVITAARTPTSFRDEGNTREKEDWETDDDTKFLNSQFVVAERLMKKSEFFAALFARRYRAITLFGPDAAKPYDDLARIRAEMLTAVRMLVTSYRQQDMGSLPQDRKKWQATLGWVMSDRDPVSERLNKLMATVESICRPVIQTTPTAEPRQSMDLRVD